MEIGDVVNCMGTPEKMTISEINGNAAKCQWFDREDQLNERWFELSTLAPISGTGN